MNFFQAQDQARKYTTRLVFLFALAVIVLIVLTNLLTMVAVTYFTLGVNESFNLTSFINTFDWPLFFSIGLVVLTIVASASFYKISQLSAGGGVVADALGGRLIDTATMDPLQRRLVNVVEEMAIASGIPVPAIYLLEKELGINAFAAGYTPANAVIGITQGALNELSRAQLQGVVAHEFSHILNGDMRMNTYLMGVLHGILIIGVMGYYILRGSAHSGRRWSSRNRGGAGHVVVFGLAVGLVIIGYSGTFFGNLIKASVSRQREYLADASAVQFTRNPGGIAGALRRIGGYQAHAFVNSPAAAEASHVFFGRAVRGFNAVFATHPPLEKRIARIDPHWDGEFDTRPPQAQANSIAAEVNAVKAQPVVAAMASVTDVVQQVDEIGQIKQENVVYAQQLIDGIPTEVHAAVQAPYGARAVIYCLVLDQKSRVRNQQLEVLRYQGDTGIHALVLRLMPTIDKTGAELRLPLIDLAMPALRQLSHKQYQLFKTNLTELVKADNKIDLFEWALQKIVFRYLDDVFLNTKPRQVQYRRLNLLERETALLLGFVIYAGHQEETLIKQAFTLASAQLPMAITLPPKSEINLSRLNQAVDKLVRLNPLQKPRLLKACAASILSDGRASVQETEILRALAATLDCPMPPLVVSHI